MVNLKPFRVGQSRGFAVVLLTLLLGLFASPSDAHRSGCDRWHSCPSDRGSYVCGDLGHCSQCSDNQFCLNGQPRLATAAGPAVLSPGTVEQAHSVRQPATVVQVIDGDTVDVRPEGGRVERLRLIGLDTPETKDPRRPVQCFGREASAKAKEPLDGKRVELEADPSQGNQDRYGRLLRYVFLPDERNFAEVMIREGYGHEYTYRLPYRYQERFKTAQREAREQERGLWSPATCGGDTTQPAKDGQGAVPGALLADAVYACEPGQIKGNRRSRIYHVPGGAFYASTKANVACFNSDEEARTAGFRRAMR